MKRFGLLLFLSVFSLPLLAQVENVEGVCKSRMEDAHAYLAEREAFLFGLKERTDDFSDELKELNEKIKSLSDVVIECIQQLRELGKDASVQDPYFDAVNEIEHVRTRVDYMARNPEAAGIFVDGILRKDFDEMMEVLLLK